MTIGELIRTIESKKRIEKQNLMEKATFDYTLAALIGRNVARIYSDENSVPTMNEVYPWLFNQEEKEKIEEEKNSKKQTLSVIRFKQFAQSYNQRHYNKGVANE